MYGLGNYNYHLVVLNKDGIIESRVLTIDNTDHEVLDAAVSTLRGLDNVNNTCVSAMDSPYIGATASI
jgi:hypothetical protein